jgi:hypothetical protein
MQLQPLPAMAPPLLQPQATLLAVSWVSRSQMGYQSMDTCTFSLHCSPIHFGSPIYGDARSLLQVPHGGVTVGPHYTDMALGIIMDINRLLQ